jgi:hypothetical protein
VQTLQRLRSKVCVNAKIVTGVERNTRDEERVTNMLRLRRGAVELAHCLATFDADRGATTRGRTAVRAIGSAAPASAIQRTRVQAPVGGHACPRTVRQRGTGRSAAFHSGYPDSQRVLAVSARRLRGGRVAVVGVLVVLQTKRALWGEETVSSAYVTESEIRAA